MRSVPSMHALAVQHSAVDAVVGALAEADSAFDFLGPIQPDTVMQQVAEGQPLCPAAQGCLVMTVCLLPSVPH